MYETVSPDFERGRVAILQNYATCGFNEIEMEAGGILQKLDACNYDLQKFWSKKKTSAFCIKTVRSQLTFAKCMHIRVVAGDFKYGFSY